MEVIRPAIKTVDKICGKQNRLPGRNYRVSKHCLSIEHEDGMLLYHMLTGSLILLSRDESMEDCRDELIRDWFLVPEDFSEKQFSDDIHRILKMMQPAVSARTDFTILTTTDCNARCFYCYEIGIPRISMDEETAAAAAAYMIRASKGNPIRIRWFGGEPLYNVKAIEIICSALKDQGAEFESSMVSNGYYLDREMIQKACRDWKLKKVQITIDGTEETYNRTKAYIDHDKNPYVRVMDNIREALEAGITVTIRMNMDAGNAEDLVLLLDDMQKRFSGYTNLEVYIALLHEFRGKIHKNDSEAQTEQAYYALRNKAKEMGVLRQKELKDSISTTRCMADNGRCEAILPDGRTGCCEHYCEAMVTGNIWDDMRNKRVEAQWQKPLQVPECSECVLYPQCVKLEMCEWNRDGCGEADRRIRVHEIKEQIITMYEKYQKGEGKK